MEISMWENDIAYNKQLFEAETKFIFRLHLTQNSFAPLQGLLLNGLEQKDSRQQQATLAGNVLKKRNVHIDVAHTSLMARAKNTLTEVLEASGHTEVPIEKTWRLNPKHYGALTSWCKSEMAGKYGEEQVLVWRRSFTVAPPPMEYDHEYYHEILEDVRYKKEGQAVDNFPVTESIQDVLNRVLPYWTNVIVPQMQKGMKPLILAHGNTLLAIIKHLDGLSNEKILKLHIPNAVPYLYELECDTLSPFMSLRSLADESTTQTRIDKVVKQGLAK